MRRGFCRLFQAVASHEQHLPSGNWRFAAGKQINCLQLCAGADGQAWVAFLFLAACTWPFGLLFFCLSFIRGESSMHWPCSMGSREPRKERPLTSDGLLTFSRRAMFRESVLKLIAWAARRQTTWLGLGLQSFNLWL